MKAAQFLTSKGDAWLWAMLENMQVYYAKDNKPPITFIGLDIPGRKEEMEAVRFRVEKLYPWARAIVHPTFSGRGLGCAGDFLNHLVGLALEEGCDRFLHLNDDISMTRYYIEYLEQESNFGKYAVLPNDGMHTPPFSNFHYFGVDYMADVYPDGKVYADTDQIYWHDTEFCVRAHCLGRLRYAHRAMILHLNWNNLPALISSSSGERNQSDRLVRDARAFVDRVKSLNPRKHGLDFTLGHSDPELDAMLKELA